VLAIQTFRCLLQAAYVKRLSQCVELCNRHALMQRERLLSGPNGLHFAVEVLHSQPQGAVYWLLYLMISLCDPHQTCCIRLFSNASCKKRAAIRPGTSFFAAKLHSQGVKLRTKILPQSVDYQHHVTDQMIRLPIRIRSGELYSAIFRARQFR